MTLLLDSINQRLNLLGLPMLIKIPCLVALTASIGLLAPTGAFGQGLVGLTPDTSAATTRTTVSMDVQNPGVAVVSNGQRSGPNLYHRFDQFDTTKDNLNRVFFDMGIRGPDNVVNNMIVGVSSTSGSHISVPLVLSQPADLIFMSPYGINVSGQAGFGWGSLAGDISNLSTIVLTTANRLDFDNSTMNFFEILPADLSSKGSYPANSPLLPDGLSAFGSLPGTIQPIGLIGSYDNSLWRPLTINFNEQLMIMDLNLERIDGGDIIKRFAPVEVDGQVSFVRGHSQSAVSGLGSVYGAFKIAIPLGDINYNSMLDIQGDLEVHGRFYILSYSNLNLDGKITLWDPVYLLTQDSQSPGISRMIVFSDWLKRTTSFPSLNLDSGSATIMDSIIVAGEAQLRVTAGSLTVMDKGIRAADVQEWSRSGYDDDTYKLYLDVAGLKGTSETAKLSIAGPIITSRMNLVKTGFGRVELNSDQNSVSVVEVLGGHLQVNGATPSIAYCNNASSNVCNYEASRSYWRDKWNPFGDPDFLSKIKNEYGIDPMASVDLATYVPSFQGLAPAPVSISSMELTPSERSIESSASSQKEYLKSLQALAPEMFNGGMPTTPTPQQIQAGMQREVQRIRSLAKGDSRGVLQSQGNDPSSWIASTSSAAAPSALPVFHTAAYQPAVVYLRFSEDHGPSQAAQPSAPGDDAFLDFTLIPLEGPVKGLRVPLSKKLFISHLRDLYASLARQDRLDPTNPASASRQLYTLLIAPIVPFLEAKGVTTLLIAADQGLQAVPFAALHDGQRFFGDRYGFSITPSLALTNFNSSSSAGQPIFIAGASKFDGLAPLPLVPQELNGIGSNAAANIILNKTFTPELFFEKAGDPHYSRVHVATHAEFQSGGPASSYLYSGVGPMPMSSFSRLRLLRKGTPLDLITFSACRTALGDPSSELGFAGLAIQAGARSAAGTLWYVDDVASSAFFIQMYRYLNQGVPKAEAVQLTRQLFMRGLLHLEGDRLLSADGSVVLDKLDSVQQRRVRDGLDHPYFWAGIELVGSPW
jgi:CHAT domain-containing protein